MAPLRGQEKGLLWRAYTSMRERIISRRYGSAIDLEAANAASEKSLGGPSINLDLPKEGLQEIQKRGLLSLLKIM